MAGASPLVVERYRKLYNAEPKARVWKVLGVKYFLTWQGGFPGGEKISVEKLDADREVNLYGLPGVTIMVAIFIILLVAMQMELLKRLAEQSLVTLRVHATLVH